jgi:flavin reductase (DIM6/NTAB) family NADH-FMN oxidoreductase RutF
MDDSLATADALRTAMRLSAQPVSVLTAGTGAEARGLTVSSFTSLSLSPPLVSFALGRETLFLPLMTPGARLALHILGADDHDLALRFALPGRTPAEQFDGLDAPADAHGVPTLPVYTSRLSGAVERLIEAGDHVLVIYAVDEVQVTPEPRPPMLYYDRAFRRLADD